MYIFCIYHPVSKLNTDIYMYTYMRARAFPRGYMYMHIRWIKALSFWVFVLINIFIGFVTSVFSSFLCISLFLCYSLINNIFVCFVAMPSRFSLSPSSSKSFVRSFFLFRIQLRKRKRLVNDTGRDWLYMYDYLFSLLDTVLVVIMTRKSASAASSPSSSFDTGSSTARYVCSMCSKVYRSGAGLRYHKRKRHRGKLVLIS